MMNVYVLHSDWKRNFHEKVMEKFKCKFGSRKYKKLIAPNTTQYGQAKGITVCSRIKKN